MLLHITGSLGQLLGIYIHNMLLSASKCTMPASSEVRSDTPAAQLKKRRGPRKPAELARRWDPN